jgi:hypothetical protein
MLYELEEFFQRECYFDHTQIRIVNDYISVGFWRHFLSRGVERASFISVFTLPFEVFFCVRHSTLLFIRQRDKQVK